MCRRGTKSKAISWGGGWPRSGRRTSAARSKRGGRRRWWRQGSLGTQSRRGGRRVGRGGTGHCWRSRRGRGTARCHEGTRRRATSRGSGWLTSGQRTSGAPPVAYLCHAVAPRRSPCRIVELVQRLRLPPRRRCSPSLHTCRRCRGTPCSLCACGRDRLEQSEDHGRRTGARSRVRRASSPPWSSAA